MKRITIPEIKQHPWFLKNLPKEINEAEKNVNNEEAAEKDHPGQSVEEIMRIVQEARTPGKNSKGVGQAGGGGGSLNGEDDDDEDEEPELDVSGDYTTTTTTT